MVEAAETGEVEVEVTGEADSQVSPEPPQAVSPTSLKTKAKVRVKARVSQGAPDTPPTRQSPVAASIIATEPTLGFVLLPSPVPGSTSAHRDHEGQTSLTEQIK